MLITQDGSRLELDAFLRDHVACPYLLIEGDAQSALRSIPTGTIDMVITSPPYWAQRQYEHPDSLGYGQSLPEYVSSLLRVFGELKRVLKPTGSFWLNLGDVYQDKNLSGIPWRVAIALQDTQGWILRNSVVWNKIKGGPDNAKDKLRNVHEYVFHFVKQKSYYYDVDAVRKEPGVASVRNGNVVTATGVSGVNYRRQIARNTSLTDAEKAGALRGLEETLNKVASGELYDFRMVIRGQQRATHSDSTAVSGRAGELKKKGYCILPYHKNGSKPGDVWDIIPEDQWRKDSHSAPFPEELCLMPIKMTCPQGGVVLDPFAGTCTAVLTAVNLLRRGIGIDISREYLMAAQVRLKDRQPVLLQEAKGGYEIR